MNLAVATGMYDGDRKIIDMVHREPVTAMMAGGDDGQLGRRGTVYVEPFSDKEAGCVRAEVKAIMPFVVIQARHVVVCTF